MLPKKPIKALIFLLATLMFVNESQSWRRRSCSSVNCRVSSWTTWSQCSAWQCGTAGNQQRTRRVITNPSCGGAGCPSNMVDKRMCYGNTPINCQVSSWSPWSVCSTVQCGKSGFEQRSRYIIRHSICGGTACPSVLQETRICYGTKPSACIYSTWSSWSSCPAFRCGETQTSSRQIDAREQCGGTPCNITALSKTRPCKQTFCVNQGTLSDGKCYCKSGFHGSCCQYSRNGKPCPYGQSGNSLKTCSASPVKFPRSYLIRPSITHKDEKGAGVTLVCKVPINPTIMHWKNVTYVVNWYADGRHVYTEPEFCKPTNEGAGANDQPCPRRNEIRSYLRGVGNNYYPGQWIQCEVKAKYTTMKANPWSEPMSLLRPFFAGIKVTPSVLTIDECKDPYSVSFTLKPTIPVRFSDGLSVRLYLSAGLLVGKDECSFILKGMKEVKVTVRVACHTIRDPQAGKWKAISPKITNVQMLLPNFWKYVDLPIVPVVVRQSIGEIYKCKSVTDPHYRLLNLESRTVWKDFMGLGDFVLYHDVDRDFEVQTRQWACNNPRSVTCNCGAIVRLKHHLIKFSCCNPTMMRDSHTPIQVDIPGPKCLPPGLSLKNKIFGSNTGYEYILPSGIKVQLVRNYWGIDVSIYTPKANGIKKGLCTYQGTSGGPRLMDKNFGNQQRASPSYFDTLPAGVNSDKDGVVYEQSCSCSKEQNDKHTDDCVDGIPVVFAEGFFNQGKKGQTIKKCHKNIASRKKREIREIVEGSDDLTDEDFRLFYNSLETDNHKRSKRSVNSISKENATRYCNEKLAETPVGKLCAKMGTNVQALVNVCSSDIEFTGDLSFAIGAVSMLMNECNDALIQNTTLPASNSTTNSTSNSIQEVIIPAIVEEIGQLLCPNDCAFNGKCVNGSCICNKDYTAEDCSISLYQVPDISRLQTNGLCDRRIRPCNKVSVFGNGFLNSTNLTCHIQEIEIVNSSWTPATNESQYSGAMTDLVIVECLLPDSPVRRTQYDKNIEGIPAAGLMISVSNNGIHQSKRKLKFISYDSVCMACNVFTGCVLKDKSCFIKGYCFAPNEPNPQDWCQQCLPEINKADWTKRQVNHPPNATSITNYYTVYGERLELPIEVSDPEGMPIAISLLEGSPKDATVHNGVLLWNVTTNKTTHFYFKATDACQVSSTFNITVTVNLCPCQNNGKCVPQTPRGHGSYLCDCAPGYTGMNCSTEINECDSYPCFRGQCVDLLNNYTCSCELGFVGRNCEHDINYCKPSPCVHGNCTDDVYSYICKCEAGWTGKRCEIDIDECESSPCINGTCKDQINGYQCQCQEGYTGKNCDVNIDECHSSPCKHGTCLDKVNGFSCNCDAGFSGVSCEVNVDDCRQASCGNGICLDGVNNYSCICNAGFTGRHCDALITSCSNNTCFPGVPCTENIISVSCGSCPSGFTGDGKNCKDIDDCASHPCFNNGSCLDAINGYSCNCLEGFNGSRCEINIDDCINNKCKNDATCIDGVNSYTCKCSVGYTGGYCENNIDDCVNHNCANGGSCMDGVNTYTCNCPPGFTGMYCEKDIDDCINNICENDATCIDGVDSYTCKCSVGYTGGYCENNIDDCVNHNCANGGSCMDGVNTYTCNCPPGFTGMYCEKDIDDCVNNICENDATCIDGVNSYTCKCSVGYTGGYCENNIDDCANHTCANGGSCMDGVNTYTCNCPSGFTGMYCEKDIDDCIRVTCNNGGTCENGINSFTCVCAYGYTGKFCDTAMPTPRPKPTRPRFAFTVSCFPSYMVAHIARDSLPLEAGASLIHLNDPSCGVNYVTEKSVIIKAPLKGCGTVRRHIGYKVSFYNKVVVPFGYGNKRSLSVFPFKCVYSRFGFP